MPRILDKPPSSKPKDNVQRIEVVKKELPRSDRTIIYPTLEVIKAFRGGDDFGPITVTRSKEILLWETEKEYAARVKSSNHAYKDIEITFPKEFPAHFKDEEGNLVRCWNNCKNRWFDESRTRMYTQELLQRIWAGPSTFPGETVNGETIVIGRTGIVLSGQHRLIGLVLAFQMWLGKNKLHWAKYWQEEPFLESLIVTGVSEHPCIVRTLDNVKSRTLADTLYTSEVFDGLTLSEANGETQRTLRPKERMELARMLDSAVDLLWKRTGAGSHGENARFSKYQTHSASSEFLKRHPRLLECVWHVFQENKDRGISALYIQPSHAATMLYLMASSSTDGDDYHNLEDPTGQFLIWDRWDKACEFWALLIQKKNSPLEPIRIALGNLVDLDSGASGRLSEKLVLLAKAWAWFLTGEPIPEEFSLKYWTSTDGVKHLDEWPDFGGIDLGEPEDKRKAHEPTPEELQAIKDKKRKEEADRIAKLIRERRANAKYEKATGEKAPTKK